MWKTTRNGGKAPCCPPPEAAMVAVLLPRRPSTVTGRTAEPMRKPAIQTARDREDRNAAGGSISLLAQTDGAAAAARAARQHLEQLLPSAELPELPPGFADAAQHY